MLKESVSLEIGISTFLKMNAACILPPDSAKRTIQFSAILVTGPNGGTALFERMSLRAAAENAWSQSLFDRTGVKVV
jgi:hypothetical protein